MLLEVPAAVQDTILKVANNVKAATDSTLQVMTPEKISDELKNIEWAEVLQTVSTQAVNLGIRIVAAIAVFYIGKFIIKRVHSLLRKILIKRDVDKSLGTFLLSFLKITLMFLLIVTVIGVLGIETSSFIAIFASAGVAIGMALSGTLQNFAGGVLILLLKPYKVGDYIEFGEFKGHVKEIQIFHTIIITYNNERIVIPNGGLSTGTINNFSAESHHRIEWRVSISYGDDVDVARRVILSILNNDKRIVKKFIAEEAHEQAVVTSEEQSTKKRNWWQRIFCGKRLKTKVESWKAEQETELKKRIPRKDCTPYVAVETLGDSAVVLVVRAWSKNKDYWNVLYQTYESIYKELPKNGVHFPFPQMDVNIKADSVGLRNN